MQYLPLPLCQTSPRNARSAIPVPFLLGGNQLHRDRANHGAGRVDECDFHGNQMISAPNFDRRRIDLAEGPLCAAWASEIGELRNWGPGGWGVGGQMSPEEVLLGDLSSRSGVWGVPLYLARGERGMHAPQHCRLFICVTTYYRHCFVSFRLGFWAITRLLNFSSPVLCLSFPYSVTEKSQGVDALQTRHRCQDLSLSPVDATRSGLRGSDK